MFDPEQTLNYSVKSASCTCGSSYGSRRSVCFVDASKSDKNNSFDEMSLVENVWNQSGPPHNIFTPLLPLVTARKIDIIKAQLLGKAKPDVVRVIQSKEYCKDVTVSRASVRMNYEKTDL